VFDAEPPVTSPVILIVPVEPFLTATAQLAVPPTIVPVMLTVPAPLCSTALLLDAPPVISPAMVTVTPEPFVQVNTVRTDAVISALMVYAPEQANPPAPAFEPISVVTSIFWSMVTV